MAAGSGAIHVGSNWAEVDRVGKIDKLSSRGVWPEACADQIGASSMNLLDHRAPSRFTYIVNL